MKTVRTFFNVAEAQFAKSVLETAGINAVLLDENMYTMGPMFAHAGVRLQVSEADMERAGQVLDKQKGFSPLPKDFEPPVRRKVVQVVRPKPIPTLGGAFVKGGLWALGIFLVLAFLALILGGTAHADFGGMVILFVLGGCIGLIVRLIYKSGREDGAPPR